MKYAGHSMGAPKLTLTQTMDLFHTLGYDGIELRVSPDGIHLDIETTTERDLESIRNQARALKLEIACLTSYYRDFVTTKRDVEMANLKKVVDAAAYLDCKLVRAYGGILPPETISFDETWKKSVEGVKILARYAKAKGVTIVVETHIGSLTYSMRETVDFVKQVDEPNVGILFDWAWVWFRGIEKSPAEAVAMADGLIKHCHVKNWRVESREPIKKYSALLDQGDIVWADTLNALFKAHYDGWFCDEYEKFWYPDELPETDVGMKQNLESLRILVHKVRGGVA